MNIIYEYKYLNNNLLEKHIIDNSSLHKYFTQDWGRVKASQYCGILNFDNQDFYILPKIANHNDEQNLNVFIYMLMYAYDVKLSNEQIASCQNQEKHTILEVFVQMFASGLLQELKKGIYKKYITEQNNLSVLKGKYLINENLKYNFIKNRIYCEYDEFSPNNELNQFFLYAVKYLQKFVKDKKLLKQCELIFDEVESWQIDINKLNIHFDRLNVRFKTSFEVAILLLKQSIPLFNQDKKSFAFLFDMNVLFEKFIARIVKEINHKAQIQNSYNFNDLLLKPDIILENQIIDTKYKKLKSIKELKQSDKLQAFAYGVNYDVRNVMLLYPKHLDEIKYNLVLGKEDKKVELKIQSIDLNYDGNDFTEYIETIKHKVREIV